MKPSQKAPPCERCGGNGHEPSCDGACFDCHGTGMAASSVSTPAQDATALREKIALEIWHRFAPESVIEWEDESNQAEYLFCADAILTLRSTPSASAGPQAEADANRKDAEEFCKGAFGPFVADVSQYVEIVAELMQHATDRAHAHPHPQQADGRGAVIDALRSPQMQAVGQAAIRNHPHYDGGPVSAYGFAGAALTAVAAALSQAPATDEAGSSHTRPDGKAAT